jgi:hypothetical protein
MGSCIKLYISHEFSNSYYSRERLQIRCVFTNRAEYWAVLLPSPLQYCIVFLHKGTHFHMVPSFDYSVPLGLYGKIT